MFASRGLIRSGLVGTIRFMSKERAGKSVRPGAAIVINGDPHRVTKITQGKRGKGGGFVKAMLKNLSTSQSYERTFTSDEIVEHAELVRETCTYSWNDGVNFYFMNTTTFEEVPIGADDIDSPKLLLEGLEVKILRFGERVIGVELPHICTYTVVSLDGSRGSAGHVYAILDSGAHVEVPEFVKVGVKIKVNTDTGDYMERAL